MWWIRKGLKYFIENVFCSNIDDNCQDIDQHKITLNCPSPIRDPGTVWSEMAPRFSKLFLVPVRSKISEAVREFMKYLVLVLAGPGFQVRYQIPQKFPATVRFWFWFVRSCPDRKVMTLRDSSSSTIISLLLHLFNFT